MKTSFDTIIVGGGSMGAAAAYFLSKNGQNVLLLEQFDFVHDLGAHGGQSRIIRKAYFEHPDYVPLLLRAYQNWADLEEIVGEKLYHQTGIIYFGAYGDTLLENTKQSANLYNIPLQTMTLAEANEKYPMFTVPSDWQVLFEPEAGFLLVEKCVRNYLNQAIKNGATLHAREKVLDWSEKDNQVSVRTNRGDYTAQKLIFCAGAWTTQLLQSNQVQIKVTRQLLGWVKPMDWEKFTLGNFPCWFISDQEEGLYYGMPIVENNAGSGTIGLKLGAHHHGAVVQADTVNRNISADDEYDFRAALEKYIPAANGDLLAAKVCLYSNSVDEHFIVDYVPDCQNVLMACGFSGHGFKFASVIGEALSDLTIHGKTDLPIDFLSLKRFNS